ncbi:Ubiquinone biosynthesis O-methyltransferase, mitochondrial [subsurface metagenome]
MPMPEEMGFFARHIERRRLRLIAGLLPGHFSGVFSGKDTAHVLDAGCGSGWLSEMLSDRGFTVCCFDLGFDSIKRASGRLKKTGRAIDFVCGDVYRLPFDDGSYDAVTASEIIEHLERPSDAISEFARVVKPGSSIVLSMPYRERIPQSLCIHCNKKTPVNAHLHSFDENIIETMLNECGFDVQKIVRFVSRPMERLGMAGLTSFLPHYVWRVLDKAACGILGRQSFMAVRAVRRD